jgi:hypothetical protein
MSSATWTLTPAPVRIGSSKGLKDECLETIRRWSPLQRDAEGMYYTARQLADIGAHDDAVDGLERSLTGGYFCLPALLTDPWLDGLRDVPRFRRHVDQVRMRHKSALVSFGVAGGKKLLGATRTHAVEAEP